MAADREGQAAPEVLFLVEEYKNIAATHDKLRDLLGRLFNYFLLLSAFPFTVAGIIFRDGGFNFASAPVSLHLLFIVVGVGHLFLALTLVDARLGQYRYARTVNAIRKYFLDHAPSLAPYLYLPVDSNVPSWEDLGYIGYQVHFMYGSGAAYTAYGAGAAAAHFGSISMGIAASVVTAIGYLAAYTTLRKQILGRYQKHKGIK